MASGQQAHTDTALLERDRELATLGALIESAAAGRSGVALVEGRAGIGKSRLIAASREQAADKGLRTLCARGTDLERDFPYGVVRQLFEPLRADPDGWERWLSGSAATARPVFEAPGADNGAPQDSSFAALHGLYWLTVNLAAEGPLLLAVDDVHWCDAPSLRFLAYLAPRLEGLPVLTVAGWRNTDPGVDAGLLAEVVGGPATVSIGPGPLSPDAVARLVSARLGADADPAFAAACCESTGGNPLLLGQLISSFESEQVRPDAEHADVVRAIGPRAVSRTVLLRLSRLDADAITTAHAVAVLGESAELPVVAELAGLDRDVTAAATATLARADILRPDPPLGFAHPLVHEAVYRDLAAAERELYHARAARLLADHGARPDQIAGHLLMTSRSGERWVVELLRQAAQTAMRQGAPDSAISYLRRALDEPAPEDMRPDLLYELAIAEEAISGPGALDHMKEARDLAVDPSRRVELGFRIAMTQLFVGEPEQALGTARNARRELPEAMVDERTMFEGFEAVLSWCGINDPSGLAGVVPYRTDPPRGGPGAKYMTVVTALDWTYKNGPAQACAELLLDAIADGELYALDGNMSPGLSGAVLTFTEYRNIASFWEDRMTDAHRRGSMFGKLTVHLWRALTLLEQGELDDSERELEAGWEGQRLWGLQISSGGAHTMGILTRTLTEQGRLADARRALESVPPEPVANYGSLTWRRARTELLLAERDFTTALDSIPELITPLADNPGINPWRSLKALALDGLGGEDHREQAIALAAEEVERARESGAHGALGRALRVLGLLRRDEGVDHLREAVAVLETSQARLERAKALFALGAVLRHARQQTEAREPLRRALELATACGAAGLADDIRSELAAAGVRPRTTATGGVESLTASERRVSGLAAEGMTNKDIAQELYVTPKTVEVHLSNAYRKLGIKSRHELAQALG